MANQLAFPYTQNQIIAREVCDQLSNKQDLLDIYHVLLNVLNVRLPITTSIDSFEDGQLAVQLRSLRIEKEKLIETICLLRQDGDNLGNENSRLKREAADSLSKQESKEISETCRKFRNAIFEVSAILRGLNV